MAYAISESAAAKAPKAGEGEDVYVKELNLLGKKYYLYVHSYLHYGLLAARAEVLKLVQEQESCPCLAEGFKGEYMYGSDTFKAVGSSSGANFRSCKKLLVKALKKDDACEHMQCTFGGIWNGGGGDGQNKLFVASFFFDRAFQADIIDNPDAVEATLKPSDFRKAARKVCAMSKEDISRNYTRVADSDLPYFCLDLAYQYTLLTDGFAIDREKEITLIKKVKYKNDAVEAAWPLGTAIEAISVT
ncbi:hypothetical protein KP509_07G042000 [Ceratopteris richardii]|nr:hypothetical protein KP509_07G042000 [Ceratopteris richardii]